MERKYCLLEDNKLCDNCLQCNLCDLDPEKICSNCMECISEDKDDFKVIKIDKIIATP